MSDIQLVTEPPRRSSALEIAMDETKAGLLWRMAEAMANASVTVPDHLKGNVADCFAVALQSTQWGMNPFPVAQKTHLIHGKLGYESQLVNAVIQANGPLQGRLQDEYFGPWENLIGKFQMKTASNGKGSYAAPTYTSNDEEGCGVRISGMLIGETKPRVLELHMREAAPRNSTLWASNPKQQLFYLAVKMWARKYCPDVILGVYTPDEVHAIPVEITEITETGSTAEVEVMASEVELEYIKILAQQPALVGDDKVAEAIARMGETKLTQDQAQKTIRIFLSRLKKAGANVPLMPTEPQPAAKDTAEPEQAADEIPRKKAMKRFHAIGTRLYADDWDIERGALVERHGDGHAKSSKDLTDEQLTRALDELERLDARRSNSLTTITYDVS